MYLCYAGLYCCTCHCRNVGASGAHLILSLSVVSWAEYARLARALTLQEKNKNYMTALKAGAAATQGSYSDMY